MLISLHINAMVVPTITQYRIQSIFQVVSIVGNLAEPGDSTNIYIICATKFSFCEEC